jgi:hypothetical protein
MRTGELEKGLQKNLPCSYEPRPLGKIREKANEFAKIQPNPAESSRIQPNPTKNISARESKWRYG